MTATESTSLIKPAALLPPKGSAPAKIISVTVIEETPSAEAETGWEKQVSSLQGEWERIKSDPASNVVVYYRFFEKVRQMFSRAYSYNEGAPTQIIAQLENLKQEVIPRVLHQS